MTMNGHSYKFFKDIFSDVQTEGKGKFGLTYNLLRKLYFDTKSF